MGASFKQGITRATVPAVAALGAVVLGARKVIGAASDLNEAQTAVNVTFGKSSDLVTKWSQDQSDAFSQVDYLAAAKSFAVYGQAAELNQSQIAGFSKGLINAAGDLASFHNVPIEESLQAIQSGLAGEVEPLRKFGILLNDAALREEALRQGLVKNTKEALTPQQRVLAAQQLILRNLGKAQGDYKRTADGAANTERRQAANTADLNAKLGQGLLPAYQALQGVLLEVTELGAKHTDVVKIATFAIAGLAAGVLLVNGALKVYKAAQIAATAATWLFNTALAANPIGLVVVALVALGVALVIAWKKSETFRNVVYGVWNTVRGVVIGFLNFFTKRVPAAFQDVLQWVRGHWPIIAVLISGPFAPLVALATNAFGIRSALVGALTSLLSAAKQKAKDIGSGIKNGIIGALAGLGGALASLVKGAINAVIGAIRSFGIPGIHIDPPGPGSFTTPAIYPFSGIPYLDRGGIIPGPIGVHRLAWVAGGETVLPTHRSGAPVGGGTVLVIDGGTEFVSYVRSVLGDYSLANGGQEAF